MQAHSYLCVSGAVTATQVGRQLLGMSPASRFQLQSAVLQQVRCSQRLTASASRCQAVLMWLYSELQAVLPVPAVFHHPAKAHGICQPLPGCPDAAACRDAGSPAGACCLPSSSKGQRHLNRQLQQVCCDSDQLRMLGVHCHMWRPRPCAGVTAASQLQPSCKHRTLSDLPLNPGPLRGRLLLLHIAGGQAAAHQQSKRVVTLSDLPVLGAGDAEAFNQADFDEVSIPESGGEGLGPSQHAHRLPMLGNVTAGSIQKSELCGLLCSGVRCWHMA